MIKMSNITQNWVKPLIPFSNGYNLKLTSSEISRKSKLPQQTVSRLLNKLVRKNLIEYIKQGKNKLFYLNLKTNQTEIIINIVENYKALEFLMGTKKIGVILEDLLEHCESIILFGSYASLKFDEKSDLDLIVFGAKDKFNTIIRQFSKEIHPHFVSHKEFEKLIKEKNPLTIEVIGNHLIFGDVSKIVKVFIKNG